MSENPETPAEQPDEDRDLVTLPDEATDEDVEFATPYYARVNDTVYYGIFATLAGTYPDDVSGLVYRTNMPSGYGPEDFSVGDALAVQLRERSAKGLSFEVVEVLEGAKGTNETRDAPVRDYSPSDTPASDNSEQAPSAAPASPSQAGLDAISTRLDAPRRH